MMKKLLVVLALLPCLVLAQDTKKEDVWEPLRPFIGQWAGTGSGNSGTSTVETKFGFVFNETYLQVTTKAVFEPQEKNPEGEIHEDLGYISYDKGRKKFVFRQFHVEGFINQYVLDSISADGNTIVFTSESLENAPPGMSARLTYTLVAPDELTSAFDLAFPGKEFSCFSQNTFKRRK